MAIIIDNNTKLLVQGITGHQGQYHTKMMREFGTNIVAGVTPGKGGQSILGVPIYNNVKKAVEETGANVSIIFVPAPYTLDAAVEAMDAGIKTLVVITEHVPLHDEMKLVNYGRLTGTRIIGPNCPGIASPGKAKVGILPNMIFREGSVGVVSKSGTLTYEIVNSITSAGMGQSTTVGMGGDRVIGTNFIDVLKLFEKDKETKYVVLVGEIGGSAEENAAEYIKTMTKPVFAYIAGQTAPPGKRMGHAGAIISRGKGTAESKIKALEAAGVRVAKRPVDIPKLIKGEL